MQKKDIEKLKEELSSEAEPMMLKEKLNMNLLQKEFHFFNVLDVFYHNMNGNVYASFSGGKDSTVMIFLIKKWLKIMGYPPIKIVFNNTTNEHKEILDFVKSFGDEVTWLRPRMTFAQTLAKYGYPLISKDQSMAISRYRKTKSDAVKRFRLTGDRGDGVKRTVGVISKKWRFMVDAPFEVTNRCCDILKKEPVKRFEKETGLKPIIGVMIEESMNRKLKYLKDGGCITFKEGKESCQPLSLFTEKDIWDLIKKYKIDICPIYYDQIIDGELVTGETRTGCAYCAFGAHCDNPDNNRFTRLQKREPKRFDSFMDKLGYRQALEFVGIKVPPKTNENETKN